MWQLLHSLAVLRDSQAFQGADGLDQPVRLARLRGAAGTLTSASCLVKFVILTLELIRKIERLLSWALLIERSAL